MEFSMFIFIFGRPCRSARFFSDIYGAKQNTMKYLLTILLWTSVSILLLSAQNPVVDPPAEHIEAKINTGLSLLLLGGLMLGAWKLHTAGRERN
jgi:hypothetical protein